jgi:Spy/CpxP family protein refolding chaperone
MEESKPMEDQINGNVPAKGTTKKGNFLSSRWAMITATAIIAIVVGFLIGHCCHRHRHCCGERCEMGRGMMMMHRGWGGGMGYGHFGRGEMDRGDMRGEGMRGMGEMGMHHGIDADARAEHMKQELGLTDQQTAQIKAIYEQNRAKLEAAMNNSDSSQRHVDWKANAEEVMAKEKAVLTPEQQAKWQNMWDDRMGHGE